MCHGSIDQAKLEADLSTNYDSPMIDYDFDNSFLDSPQGSCGKNEMISMKSFLEFENSKCEMVRVTPELLKASLEQRLQENSQNNAFLKKQKSVQSPSKRSEV